MKKVVIKLIVLCSCLILLESLTYLLAKLTPITPIILTNYIHENTPLVKGFVIFYYLWYIMLFVFPILLYFKNREILKEYIMTYILVVLISLPIFFLFPTTLIRPEINDNSFFSLLIKLVYLFDTPALNCFPSMHCTMCFIFIYYAFMEKKFPLYYKLFILIISIFIIISTVLIKQHVTYDILAAFLLTLMGLIIVKNTNIKKYSEIILRKFSL